MKENKICLVLENRNVGTIGRPHFIETILFRGSEKECVEYEDEKRKEYRRIYGDNFSFTVNCWTEEEKKIDYIKALNNYKNSLTKEQSEEVVIIDGKKYMKYALDFKKQYYK